MNYIYCALIYAIGANIAKVESRGKIYFHYAETKHIYERQLKYKKNILPSAHPARNNHAFP